MNLLQPVATNETLTTEYERYNSNIKDEMASLSVIESNGKL